MTGSFYGVELLTSCEVGVLPPILGSIQAWRALDAGTPITFVRSRPDIIAYHLGGTSYFSNIQQLEADLVAMQHREPEPGELRLLELRRVEHGRIPLGIFAPVSGWPLRDLIGFVRCEPPLAAAIALQIYRGYSGAANIVTPSGELVREMLPHFGQVWRRATGSFIGHEPDISLRGRIKEARDILATVGALAIPERAMSDLAWEEPETDETDEADGADGPDEVDEAEARAFEAELAALARGVALGPMLARLLATRHGYISLW